MMIPMLRVTAKPFIGPVPKMKRTKVVISVVMWASKIVTQAFDILFHMIFFDDAPVDFI